MKEEIMRKIQYKEKAIKDILLFLSTQGATFATHEEAIVVTADKSNETTLFSELNKLIKATKYMVQKEVTTFTITVFNGSV